MGYIVEYVLTTLEIIVIINLGIIINKFFRRWKKDETILFMCFANIIFIIYRIYSYNEWLKNQLLWDNIMKNINK